MRFRQRLTPAGQVKKSSDPRGFMPLHFVYSIILLASIGAVYLELSTALQQVYFDKEIFGLIGRWLLVVWLLVGLAGVLHMYRAYEDLSKLECAIGGVDMKGLLPAWVDTRLEKGIRLLALLALFSAFSKLEPIGNLLGTAIAKFSPSAPAAVAPLKAKTLEVLFPIGGLSLFLIFGATFAFLLLLWSSLAWLSSSGGGADRALVWRLRMWFLTDLLSFFFWLLTISVTVKWHADLACLVLLVVGILYVAWVVIRYVLKLDEAIIRELAKTGP